MQSSGKPPALCLVIQTPRSCRLLISHVCIGIAMIEVRSVFKGILGAKIYLNILYRFHKFTGIFPAARWEFDGRSGAAWRSRSALGATNLWGLSFGQIKGMLSFVKLGIFSPFVPSFIAKKVSTRHRSNSSAASQHQDCPQN